MSKRWSKKWARLFCSVKIRVQRFHHGHKVYCDAFKIFFGISPPIVADEKGCRWVAVFFVNVVNLEGQLRVYVGSVKMLERAYGEG